MGQFDQTSYSTNLIATAGPPLMSAETGRPVSVPGVGNAIQAFFHGRAALAVFLALAMGALAASASTAAVPDAVYIPSRGPASAPDGFAGMCSTYPRLCRTSESRSGLDRDYMGVAQKVNLEVNRNTTGIEDLDQYGVSDYWALPTARGGDCEDFAMLKKILLVQNGIPGQDLLIATVLNRQRENHAVLVLRTGSGDFVLDSLTNRILPWAATGYTFLTMQDPETPRNWNVVLQGGLIN